MKFLEHFFDRSPQENNTEEKEDEEEEEEEGSLWFKTQSKYRKMHSHIEEINVSLGDSCCVVSRVDTHTYMQCHQQTKTMTMTTKIFIRLRKIFVFNYSKIIFSFLFLL